jgi:hypothetical protein
MLGRNGKVKHNVCGGRIKWEGDNKKNIFNTVDGIFLEK